MDAMEFLFIVNEKLHR